MNQRIREFIDQATIRGVEYLAGNDGHPTPTIYFDKEKFAELIIKECTNMLPEDSIRKDGVHMYYIIREHFGVDLFRGVKE